MKLAADELLAAARAQTGLDDLGDEGLPGRLARLAQQLDLRLDEGAKARAAAVVHGLLTQRLRFFEARRQLPIADEVIERPIIAMGEARSGTTVLQMLLGCDPASRLLEFWEVMRLTAPPGADERRRQGDDDWREILDQIPRWLVSHPYNGMLGRNPPECERTWAFDFRALPPSAWWRVPGVHFPPVDLPRDDVRQLEIHRMVLQHLQHGAPRRRWVLKGIAHQHRLPALLDAYPDAVLVWIHRDPLDAIASKFELQAQVYEGITPGLDRRAFAAHVVRTSVANFRSAANDPCASDPRIHHLRFVDFVVDPFTAVRDLYERAGLPYTDGLDTAMRRWSAENPSDRYGRFTYSVDALGVDVVDLDRSLEPYRERFLRTQET